MPTNTERDIMVLKGVVNSKTFNRLFRSGMTLREICISPDVKLLAFHGIGGDTLEDIRKGMAIIRHCELCIKEGQQYLDRGQS